MSIFTKIFVVLVMLLSVLLVGLIVPFVVNVDTFKARWLDEKTAAAVARGNEANKAADLDAALQAKTAEIQAKQDQNARMQALLNEKDRTLLEQQGKIINLETANTNVQTELARLATAEEQHAKIIAMQNDELKVYREDSIKLTTRNVELTEKLNEKTTEATTLERQVRLYAEQIKELENQNQELGTRVDLAGAGKGGKKEYNPLSEITTGISPEHPIRGIVTEAQQIGDEMFIAINVGSNDGVREGMKFMVHRGDTYLGDAVILQVDLNTAAGRVTLQSGTIKPNEAEVLAGGTP